MTICKYFLRNSCAFGNRCRFEHVLPDNRYSGYENQGVSVMRRDVSQSSNNVDYNYSNKYQTGSYYPDTYGPRDPYHYYRNNNQSHNKSHSVNKTNADIKDNSFDEVLSSIKSDIASIERNEIWPLTCMSAVRTLGSLSDWYDFSPEEVRWAGYIAKSTNDFDSYKATIEKLLNEAKMRRDLFKFHSKELITTVKEYMLQTSSTIHCLNIDILGYCSHFTLQPNNSALISNETAPSFNIFGNVQNSFSLSYPGSNSPDSFQNNSNPFENVTNPSYSFKFNVFSSPLLVEEMEHNSVSQDSNNFGSLPQHTNIFGSVSRAPNIKSHNYSDSGEKTVDIQKKFGFTDLDLDYKILALVWKGDSPYTKTSDLTDEELEQFKATKFIHGKVPLAPPPKEFC